MRSPVQQIGETCPAGMGVENDWIVLTNGVVILLAISKVRDS